MKALFSAIASRSPFLDLRPLLFDVVDAADVESRVATWSEVTLDDSVE
jgi:hypothetical protein